MVGSRVHIAQAEKPTAGADSTAPKADTDQPAAKDDKPNTVRTSHVITSGLKLLVLYFSGRWCPVCAEFDTVIRDVYAGLKSLEESSDIEVVWIPCDLSEDACKIHLRRIGSLLGALWSPKRLQELSDRWKVSSIPTALVLDARDGRVVTACARRDMEEVHERAVRRGSKDTRNSESYGALMFRWLELLDAQRAALDDGMPLKIDESSDSESSGGSVRSSRNSRASKASSRRNSTNLAQQPAEDES